MPILDGELRTAAREVFDEATRKSWEWRLGLQSALNKHAAMEFSVTYEPRDDTPMDWGTRKLIHGPTYDLVLSDDGTPALDENGQWIWERRS